MTIAVWPESLPCFVSMDSFSTSFADGRLKTATDTGPGKTRRRTTAAVEPLAGNLSLRPDQYLTLKEFWRVTLKGGTLPFFMPDQDRHARTLLTDAGEPLLTDAGEAMQISAWCLVIFGSESPTVSKRGPSRYSVSINLNVLRTNA